MILAEAVSNSSKSVGSLNHKSYYDPHRYFLSSSLDPQAFRKKNGLEDFCSGKNFKIRRIIEYPDTEEEGEGGKE